MPPELHYEVKREMGGMGCANGWGMTESCITAINDPRDTDDHLAYTSGKPIRRLEVRVVVGRRQRRCRPTSTASCGSGAIGLFKGYLDPIAQRGRRSTPTAGSAPATSAASTRDGYVVVTGRLKDIIIRKGENISAKEVEDVLYAHPTGRRRRGDRPARRRAGRAVLRGRDVARRPTRSPSLDDDRRYCSDAGLMRQKIPEQLEIVDRAAPQRHRQGPQARAPQAQFG